VVFANGLAYFQLTAALATELKIGFVNSQRCSAEVLQGRADRGEPRRASAAPSGKSAPRIGDVTILIYRLGHSELGPRNRWIEKTQQAIGALWDRLPADQAVMNEVEAQKLRWELFNNESDLQYARQNFQDDLNIRRNEELSTLQHPVAKAIAGIGESNGSI